MRGDNQIDVSPVQSSRQTRKKFPRIQSVPIETEPRKNEVSTEIVQTKRGKRSSVVSSCVVDKQIQPPSEDLTKNPLIEQSGLHPTDYSKTGRNSHPGQLTSKKKLGSDFGSVRRGSKQKSKLSKKKYILRSSHGNKRALRPRSLGKHKAHEPRSNVANGSSGRENKLKKKKRVKKIVADEFSRIRRHLKYLLNRMSYEQSLIDAYSGEGWKGLSLEKLKPEKELQRATSEILRRKLSIRNQFQNLDSLCAEGAIPKSSFDSDGEISSEDIFCAKCGSKDVYADNDIILCDGACDRGFHQFCLEPPLLKEDFPPDDEGWLCPGCDCKFDCIELLNETQGANLSMSDCWEKVFPEAAKDHDNNHELSSEDSEDDDYDPDGPDIDMKDQGDESGSEKSYYSSASDDAGPPSNNEQYLGLPSEDSEDDDYDPNAPHLDDKVKEESSSSDFTSDSEDFSTVLGDKKSSLKDDGNSFSNGGRKNQSLNDELLSILEINPDQNDLIPARRKRHVERLDYKMLYDETYGNVPSDSSDEESWSDTVAPRKRNKGTVSASENTLKLKNATNTDYVKYKVRETGVGGNTPEKKTHQKQQIEGTNDSPAKLHKGSPNSGPSDTRRLREAKRQRLNQSFEENQYPDKATKESLAAELELPLQKVAKWFENARWSFRHSSCTEPCSASCTARYSSKKGNPRQIDNKPLEPGPKMVERDDARNGAEAGAIVPECSKERELKTQGDGGQNPGTTNSRKRKRKSKLDQLASDLDSTIEKTPKAPQEQTGGRVQTRSRKSVA